jgi:hypothetical protein
MRKTKQKCLNDILEEIDVLLSLDITDIDQADLLEAQHILQTIQLDWSK